MRGKKVQKSSKESKQGDIFDFKEEIVIGINSKKAVEKKKNVNSTKTAAPKNKKALNKGKAKTTKKRKSKKEHLLAKAFLKWTILIALLIVAIIYFMMSPLFNISEITIEGENQLSSQEILDVSGLQLGENIYNFSKIKTMESIKENPYISTVEIKRKLPSTVKVIITERTPSFLTEVGNAYMYIDNQGYILEVSNDKLELPILTSLSTELNNAKTGDRLNSEDLKKLGDVLQIVSVAKTNSVYDKIINIDIADSSNLIINLQDEKTAYLGDVKNLNIKMWYLSKILESEKGNPGEIFLSSENNIFFREKV